MPINQKYSFRNFTGQSFVDEPAEDFSNSEIRGSCFSQDNFNPGRVVFPAGMTGVNFERCNLDNVQIIGSNTLDERCTNRRIESQNDGKDWIINGNRKPDHVNWIVP